MRHFIFVIAITDNEIIIQIIVAKEITSLNIERQPIIEIAKTYTKHTQCESLTAKKTDIRHSINELSTQNTM